ncbi:MAG: 3-isopropylmalate dehydrogenase [Acidobacteria bacterium]|nr:3-isopropylmalate dehydrogenase [Acidobacteriota bacterium]
MVQTDTKHILVLPGDGIGPEVTCEALSVLKTVEDCFGHEFEISEQPIGGAALREFGEPLPAATLEAALKSDAVLLGAVGSPEFASVPFEKRPEAGLLALRQHMRTYANLRPVTSYSSLAHFSPLRSTAAVDLMIVRELTGGLYFGEPRFRAQTETGERVALNTLVYNEHEVRRVATVAFEAARKRRQKLTSVDKANVLETSQLWREIVNEVACEYPDIALEHMYVDNCAMQLILHPERFDVVLTENLFGDILSDEAAVLAGSLGMLPSASLGDGSGLYEPVHGSAPDIAGQGKANPIGAILSVAMMLRHSFHLEAEAKLIETAVSVALDNGFRTTDLTDAHRAISTSDFGKRVCQYVEAGIKDPVLWFEFA